MRLMETPPLRAHRKFEMEDRISFLPSNVIETILMCLPIRDAGRTSVLSSRWRYAWSSIPDLIFNGSAVGSALRCKLVGIVNQVLLLHNAPIHKFSYNGWYTYERNTANIGQWLIILSRNGIKELEVVLPQNIVYKLPSTLFACQKLVYLELHSIEIELPRVYTGFSMLTTLVLVDITITDSEFADLISKCPLLRKLVFKNFFECTHLIISAPNLHELKLTGPFDDLHFENTPLLAIVSVTLEDGEEESLNENPDGFLRSLSNVPRLERLEFGYSMMEFLAKGSAFGGFGIYNYLTKVHLCCFNFRDKKHVLFLRCLLQSSPVLQELEIEVDSIDSTAVLPGPSSYHGQEWTGIRFDHLRKLYVFEVDYVQPELNFIKLVLANAPVLETLIVGLDFERAEDIRTYEQIMSFQRCSSRVKVT